MKDIIDQALAIQEFEGPISMADFLHEMIAEESNEMKECPICHGHYTQMSMTKDGICHGCIVLGKVERRGETCKK